MTSVEGDQSGSAGPLDGLVVVDVSVTLPGPFCTQLLRRLGARVTHLAPLGGDPIQAFAPAAYAWLSCGKEVIEVDLKSELGRGVALKRMRSADVVVEGWRPRVAERLGVGYEQVAAANPKVVYCSLSGYGSQGPLADRPGHDINYVAEAGALTLTSTAGLPVADLAGASAAATRIVAELCRAQRTGHGGHLDASLTCAVVDWVSAIGGAAYEEFVRIYDAPHYGAFATLDEHVVTIGVLLEQPQWGALITALGRPEWADLDLRARFQRAAELVSFLSERFSSLDSDQVDELLDGVDTCWAWARVPGSPVRASGGFPA